MEIGIQNQTLVSNRQWEVSAAVNRQLVLIRVLYHTIKAKKHREGKGQLEGARNFCSITVVLWKY